MTQTATGHRTNAFPHSDHRGSNRRQYNCPGVDSKRARSCCEWRIAHGMLLSTFNNQLNLPRISTFLSCGLVYEKLGFIASNEMGFAGES
jgi:hypothetical protein